MRTVILMIPFFLLTSIFAPAHAQVEFQATQQILMQGSSCQELEKFSQSILGWTTSLYSSLTQSQPECFCSSTSCQMDVAGISPYLVVELTNFRKSQAESAYNGPNCFNAALYASNTQTYISFTHPYEMTALMESSLCQERTLEEQLQPGDILVVRDQTKPFLEIHAGVYIDEQLSFSKYGENKMMPYSYGLNVHRTYGVRDPACERVYGKPQAGSVCEKKPYVNYFKCTAMHTFVSKIFNQPEGINESVRQIYAQTSSLDNKISGVVFKGRSITGADLRNIREELVRLYEETVTISNTVTLNTDNTEFLKLLHYRIYSIYEQTRRITLGSGHSGTPETLSHPVL